mmetsp:Transcript_30935/g.72142  ORF Transcript_30935/g.72142 Transcript_30935/m.72142 type:complete len:202 (+) Transcript_30935:818-1423(+)
MHCDPVAAGGVVPSRDASQDTSASSTFPAVLSSWRCSSSLPVFSASASAAFAAGGERTASTIAVEVDEADCTRSATGRGCVSCSSIPSVTSAWSGSSSIFSSAVTAGSASAVCWRVSSLVMSVHCDWSNGEIDPSSSGGNSNCVPSGSTGNSSTCTCSPRSWSELTSSPRVPCRRLPATASSEITCSVSVTVCCSRNRLSA